MKKLILIVIGVLVISACANKDVYLMVRKDPIQA